MKKLVLILFVFATNTLSTLASVEKEVPGDIRHSCSYVHHDPIVEAKTSASQYTMRTYNTGYVTFGISVY